MRKALPVRCNDTLNGFEVSAVLLGDEQEIELDPVSEFMSKTLFQSCERFPRVRLHGRKQCVWRGRIMYLFGVIVMAKEQDYSFETRRWPRHCRSSD
eukprot:scaffold9085_cov215-Amphora_coffeaeformis.AAC.17